MSSRFWGWVTADRNLAAYRSQLRGGINVPAKDFSDFFEVAIFAKDINQGRGQERSMSCLCEALVGLFKTCLF